jgi:hypothetical protein
MRVSLDIDQNSLYPVCRLDLVISDGKLGSHAGLSLLDKYCYKEHISSTIPKSRLFAGEATSQPGHNDGIGDRIISCSHRRLGIAMLDGKLGSYGPVSHIEVHIHRKHISEHALH